MLERLRGGLIVSVQAEPASHLNAPASIALLARVAEANGAAAVRVEGGARIGAVRRAVRIPIIGIVKRVYPAFEPYITVSEREIAEASAAGADIIAFDATLRPRPGAPEPAALIAAIQVRGSIAMADCAEPEDGRAALAAGAGIIATTLHGYTAATRGATLPAFDLVRTFRDLGGFVVCEGGVASPGDVEAAFALGADAVVVGTAITNVDALVRRYVAATKPT